MRVLSKLFRRIFLFYLISILEIMVNYFIFNQSNVEYIEKFDLKSLILFRLRLLLHKALVKCCTTNEKSVSKMSTSDNEDDITPDLEELDSENDDENLKLSQILQKISECNYFIFCFVIY